MDFHKEMRGFFMHSVCLPEKVTEHFLGLSGRVLELKRQGGHTWHVGLIGSGGKLILQPGWSTFASANNISQNDLLLFKFMGESKFEVQIFNSTGYEKFNDPIELVGTTKRSSLESNNSHVEESRKLEINIPATRRLVQNLCKLQLKRGHKDCGGCSYKKEEEEKMCDELNKKEMRQRTSRGLIPRKELCGVLHQEKEELDDLVPGMMTNATKGQSQNPRKCVSPYNEVIYQSQRGGLNAGQKRRAKQLASEVQARNPSFLRVITRASVTGKCYINIPSNFSAEHLPKETWDVVLRWPKKEMMWPVKYYYRKTTKSFEGTPWRKFVRENKLQEGDMCLFEMIKATGQITFVVHISRAIPEHVG